jgi:hypothetical protein
MRLLAAVVLMGALSSTSVWAQSHLEPEDSPFSSSSTEYYSAVGKTLLGDVPAYALTVVTIPSFEVEWAAWILHEPVPKACSRAASRPIWNGGNPSKPNLPRRPPTPRCAALSRQLADDLQELWAAMLRQVRIPPPSNVITMDGISYHFSANDKFQNLSGQVANPEPDTTTGRLVEVAMALRAYSTAPSPEKEKALCRLVAAVRPEGSALRTRCIP